jgi:hypothetical protein
MPGAIDAWKRFVQRSASRVKTPSPPCPASERLARVVFTTFLLTFIASRVLVILIMAKKVPDLFLHMGGTHVHHLNYGIFLLSAVGGVLLFVTLTETAKRWVAVAYGFGMALTFDEFGMWLHLGGSYWQRASFDAVIVVLSLIGMIAFFPRLDRMRTHHWATAGVTFVAVVGFYWMLYRSMNLAEAKVGPKLHSIEESGPQ